MESAARVAPEKPVSALVAAHCICGATLAEVAMPQPEPHPRLAKYKLYHLKNRDKILQRNKDKRLNNLEAVRAQDRQYYAEHKERKRKQARIRRQRNREKALVYEHKRYERDKTKRLAAGKAYRLAHQEAKNQRDRAYQQAHPEIHRAANARYRKNHPESHQFAEAKRRATKANAPINDLTRVQWEEIKQSYHHRCVYCRKKPSRLTKDHLTPLSKGGSHTKSNIVPACGSCNSRKGTKGVLRPIQPLLL